jgi:hypothetical protein
MHNTAIIHDPGHVGGEPDGCTFEKTSRETDRPGIEPLSDLRLSWDA